MFELDEERFLAEHFQANGMLSELVVHLAMFHERAHVQAMIERADEEGVGLFGVAAASR